MRWCTKVRPFRCSPLLDVLLRHRDALFDNGDRRRAARRRPTRDSWPRATARPRASPARAKPQLPGRAVLTPW